MSSALLFSINSILKLFAIYPPLFLQILIEIRSITIIMKSWHALMVIGIFQ